MRLGNQAVYSISQFRNKMYSDVRSVRVDRKIFYDVRTEVFINVQNSMSWM